MDDALKTKLDRLRRILADTGGCAVAYSGGVDSSLLLAAAREVLGDRCLAVIATSSTYPTHEFHAAVQWAERSNVCYVVLNSEELDIPEFSDNRPDRCYHCKYELFTKVRAEAERYGITAVADGSNVDDTDDYRPGMQAACDLEVISPLKEAALTKDDIRTLAREVYDLPMADKPATACLASRFPYGSKITRQKLGQVEQVERFLASHGFDVCRARHHGDIVRLEVNVDKAPQLFDQPLRNALLTLARRVGFAYVAVDLEGYRTGSMNEVLGEERHERTV